jgi:hypothetical protein
MEDSQAANQKVLQDTVQVQDQTKAAIWRIQKHAAGAEELGTETIAELRRQGIQMDDINAELDSVSGKLDQSSALQNKFDRWAGNWLGGKKAAAHKEAAAEIKLRNEQSHTKIKEVFQHEKYDSVSRKWRRAGMYLCTDTSISCTDLFDPAIQDESSRWSIDFSLTGIDAEGWTYAYDFSTLNRSGAGEKAPKWNTYVRRRKWRYDDKNSSSSAMNAVRERNHERMTKQPQHIVSSSDKISYVPRNKQAAKMTESGFTNTKTGFQRKGHPKEQLDAESAEGLQRVNDNDAEINAGIDAIGRTLDNLNNISTAMKDEAIHQQNKLETMDDKMQRTTEKQTVVNARQRYLLR